VHEVVAVQDGEEAVLDTLRGLNPASEAVVEAPLPGPVSPAPGDAVESVTVVRRTSNSLDIEVRLAAPGFLLVSEVWYPGWRAWLDGQPVPVLRANYILRGVYIPKAGEHTVRLKYVPVLAYVGAGILAVVFLSIVLMRFAGGKR
jgi:uncharacterized membrane protein YfhO